jgi:ubiquinone/menaquinone biosynthesis C-methylase UbiE
MPLEVEGADRGSAPESLREGALRCAQGHRFALTGGVPRLLAGVPPDARSASTRRAFERQWRHYAALRRVFGKDRARMRANLVNERMGARIRADWYPGRVVLDAGCGHGRYLEAFASLGATAVGVDVGTGPEEAGARLDDPRIDVVQGDVLRLPFLDAQFDLAFCDGVLHHTTDPRAGFLELARVVKPGGAVYAWLYPKEGALREAVFGAARAVTTRLPGPIARGLCFLLAPLTAFVRSYSGTRFPRATWSECAQVVHDWLTPPLQSHHTLDEVSSWAREAGLVDLERLPIPVGVVAWKPAS